MIFLFSLAIKKRILGAAKEEKGVRWMPRLRKAKKDVASCEKLRVGASNH